MQYFNCYITSFAADILINQEGYILLQREAKFTDLKKNKIIKAAKYSAYNYVNAPHTYTRTHIHTHAHTHSSTSSPLYF